ncbi:hypothetical protein GWI34_10250 [Actinomadura sp. DSM 109109]|nr:hypothetical protein [Actinomadura lepetitiana]
MRATGEDHSVKLHHRVSSRQVSDMIVADYRVTPVRVRRPSEGSSLVEVRCGACDRAIPLRVHSIRRTRNARLRWLGMVALALSAVAAGTYLQFNAAAYGYSIALAIVAPLAFISGLVAAVFLTFRWFQEDGVRVVTPQGAGHELIPMVR